MVPGEWAHPPPPSPRPHAGNSLPSTLCYRLGTYAMAPDFAVLAAANEENHEAKVAKLTVERTVDQCRYSADRFFDRLKASASTAASPR